MNERNIFYLPVDGQLVEVTPEVYYAFYQNRRRANYLKEMDERHGVISYHAIIAKEKAYLRTTPSSEEILIAAEESLSQKKTVKELHELLHRSIVNLSEEDQALLQAIFYEGKSDREYGKCLGISHTAVRKRREKVLSKLREKFFEKKP